MQQTLPSHHCIAEGNFEALDQGIELLNSLSDKQYQCVVSDYVSSSIGQHFRHILDMYHAVLQAMKLLPTAQPAKQPLLDYDQRRRGARVETDRSAAITELQLIRRQLERHCQSAFDATIQIKTEVSLDHSQCITLQSTLARELIFTSAHAIHHYALIKVIAKLQGVELDPSLGMAPASASYARQQDAAG